MRTGGNMTKYLIVKKEFEDKPRRIEATRFEEKAGHLCVYNSDEKVADFLLNKLEDYSFESEAEGKSEENF
jgi:hypothetical protein